VADFSRGDVMGPNKMHRWHSSRQHDGGMGPHVGRDEPLACVSRSFCGPSSWIRRRRRWHDEQEAVAAGSLLCRRRPILCAARRRHPDTRAHREVVADAKINGSWRHHVGTGRQR